MTPEVRDFVWRVTRPGNPWGGPRPRRVVELGSREVAGGTVRALFPDAEAYTGVDLVPGPAVDVVADAAVWRPAVPPQLVLCLEVLEHTPHGLAILDNAYAMLAPGGRLVVTAAAPGRAPHSAVDGAAVRDGEYYGNVDPDALRCWLRRFTVEAFEEHPARGDVYAAARRGAA